MEAQRGAREEAGRELQWRHLGDLVLALRSPAMLDRNDVERVEARERLSWSGDGSRSYERDSEWMGRKGLVVRRTWFGCQVFPIEA